MKHIVSCSRAAKGGQFLPKRTTVRAVFCLGVEEKSRREVKTKNQSKQKS